MHESVDLARRQTSRSPGFPSWGGRAFGGILLAAFLLLGVGRATADRPIGLLLVAANSIAVALAGWIGLRLVRYAALGAGLELVAGYSLAPFYAVPGGFFEFVLGVRLLGRGFDHRSAVRRIR